MLVLLACSSCTAVLGCQGSLTEPTILSIPWNPPASSLDPSYVKLAKMLLGNGLSDPREGQFCRVKVAIGFLPFETPSATEAFGWVLPDDKQAVLMDGLEYPIQSKIGPADLDETVGMMLAEKSTVLRPFTVNWNTDVTPALLLLVGRADLAERLLKPGSPQAHEFPAFSLCAELYRQAQYQFAKAFVSHKDKEGIVWASLMLKIATIQNREAIVTRWPLSSAAIPPVQVTRDLYTDVRRRFLGPQKDPIYIPQAQKLETGKRLTLFMENLDNIIGRQFLSDSPDELDYSRDPLYKAILAEGQKAIPELIDSLEFDKRYSRSVSYAFGTPYPTILKFHSVVDVIHALLGQIWPASKQMINTDPIAMASVLRQAWREQSGNNLKSSWGTDDVTVLNLRSERHQIAGRLAQG